MAISYGGKGTLSVVTNGATNPGLPAGLVEGDLLVMVDAAWRSSTSTTPATPGIPSGWTRKTTNAAIGTEASLRLSWYYARYTAGMSAPSVSYSGNSGDVHVSQIVRAPGALASGDPTDALGIAALGTSSSTTIGPVDGIDTLAAAGSLVLVLTLNENDANDGSSIGTLSGDGLTWAEIEEYGTGAGHDFILVWDYAVTTGAQTITDKTFTWAGPRATRGFGQMWAIAAAGPVEVNDTTPAAVLAGAPSGEQVAQAVVVDDTDSAGALAASPAGEDVGAGVQDDTPGGVLVAAPAGESLDVEEVGLPLGGEMNVAWWAIHPDTGAHVALPHVGPWTISPIANKPGSIRVDYPAVGLNFDVLDDFVTPGRDLEVEIWFSGRQSGALRGILCEKAFDGVADEKVATFGGHFLEWRMTKVLVTPDNAHPKKETVFSAATAGTVLATLMQRAHDRGTATDLTFSTFTSAVDSNGVAWSKTITAAYSPVQTTYAQVLDELVELGVCEWEITAAHELKLYEPGTRGTDRTVGPTPTVLRRGRNLTDVPVKVSSRDGGTDLWAVGKDGLYHHEFDATARTLRGRQDEVAYSANNIDDAGALDAAATARLPVVTAGRREVTHGLVFGAGDPLPVAGFDLGDWLYSNIGDTDVAGGGNERLRLRQWTLSRDGGGDYSGSVTLNDLFAERLVDIAYQLARLQSGSTVVGTSTSPPGEDTLAPAAPVGVTVDSLAYQEGIDTFATLIVGWSEVTTNADASVADDVAGYRVEWREESSPANSWNLGADTSAVSASFGGVGAGVDVRVRVFCYDRNGNVSASSAEVVHLTEDDTTAPPTPSTPVVTPYLGQLKVAWDGLGSVGEAMPADLERVEVHLSTSAGFTPSAATLVDHFSTIAGVRVLTDLPYDVGHFVRLVAVDLRGNASAPSAVGSATPSQVVSSDVFDGAIGTAKLADLAVTTAKIDDLAVNNAKIGDLEVGKLTSGVMTASVTNSGIIRSGLSGQRYEIDAASFRLYNSAGTQTVGLTGSSGTNFITGELRTALSGERIALNPNGTAPNEMRFYPTSGSMFAQIRAFTDTGPVYNGEAGMVLRAHAQRADGATGEVSVIPGRASLSFGEEGGSPILSRVAAEEHQVNMIGARVHISSGLDVDTGDGFDAAVIRFGISTNNAYITQSLIQHGDTNGNGSGNGYLWCVNRGSGIQFDTSVLSVIVNPGTPGPIAATEYRNSSSRKAKTNIRDLPFDPLQAIINAPAQEWEYLHDQNRPGRPPGRGPDGRPHPPYDFPNVIPKHVGPMAEDLPPTLVRNSLDDGTAAVDVASMVGVLWAAVAQLAARLPGGGASTGGPL